MAFEDIIAGVGKVTHEGQKAFFGLFDVVLGNDVFGEIHQLGGVDDTKAPGCPNAEAIAKRVCTMRPDACPFGEAAEILIE